MNRAKTLVYLLGASLLVVGTCSLASAQSRTCSIVGTVTDSSGAVIPGAHITVTNVGTGEVATTTTTAAGEYTVLNLLYGQYVIAAARDGFTTAKRTAVQLEIGQRLKADFVLRPGTVQQAVVVKGAAPLLSTQSSTVSQVISSRAVLDMPLVGRNWLNLATLSAGAVAPRATTGPGYAIGSAVAVNGNNADMNNFTIDGVENNALLQGNQSLNPTIDAIQEFRIDSSVPGAEYGRAGAQIAVATKSGTNQFHGDLYEFLRNNDFDARGFFDFGIPPLHQSTFGGTLGGPIRRDKSWFFFSYDGLRELSSATGYGLMPSAAFMQGNFSSLLPSVQLTDGYGHPLPGNIVPSASINPTATALLKIYPSPNLSNNAVYNYVNLIGTTDSAYQWSARVDYDFNENNQLFVRVTPKQSTVYNPGLFPIGIGGYPTDTPGANVGIGYTHTFSSTKINILRLGYSYYNNNITPQGYGKSFGSAVLPPSGEDGHFGFIDFTLAGYTGIGFGNRYIKEPDEDIDGNDTFDWIVGKHSLKIGADLRRWRENLAESFAYSLGFNGEFTGNSVADMLYGYANSGFMFGGHLLSNLRRWDESDFIQDDWRVTRDLTLNLGLRWDYIGPFSDSDNNLENWNFQTGQLELPGTPGWPTGANNANRSFRDLNNFGPRVGLAWSPSWLAGTVVRMGYGLFYDPSEGQLDLILGPKDDTIYTFSGNVSNPAGLGFSNPAPTAGFSAGYPEIEAADPHIPTPYIQQWNFTLQHEFKGNLLAQVGYLGNQGVKLGVIVPFNVPEPGPGAIQSRRPYPAIGYSENNEASGRSSYSALQAKLEKRYSHGLSLLASYTFAKDIDNNSFLGSRIYNPFDIGQDEGLADQAVRNSFVTGWNYYLPVGRGKDFLKSAGPVLNDIVGGWMVGSITTFQSGMPFTVSALGDPGNWGLGTRPNVVGQWQLPNPGLAEWFNVNAFQNPAQYTIGNEGRNLLTGPGLNDWDVIVAKELRIRERHLFQFRGEFFNAFNHAQFNNPGATLGAAGFGVITSANPGRIIQLALKYYF